MKTYCSNPRCDNRCGGKPPANLGPGTYVWGDFCSPTRYPPADQHECPPTGVVCPVCVDVADEDEADPDEPTDAEPTTATIEEWIRSAPSVTVEIERQATEEDLAEIANEWFGTAEDMPDLPPLPDLGGSD